MFFLFNLHRPNLLPIIDLKMRKGTCALWGLKGHGEGGGLYFDKDMHIIEERHMPFVPYRSISSYYMYKLMKLRASQRKNWN
jgi:3-methyladenine DNA glycosylase/8-oxoguanine DNA glycosylase